MSCQKNNIIIALTASLVILLSCAGSDKKETIVSYPIDLESPTITESIEIKQKTELKLYLDSLGLIDIKTADSTIHIDLKYATTDNFTGDILYNNLNIAYLHPKAMDKLEKAQRLLKANHPQLSLLVYDAARPLSIQKKMYDVVKNTKYHAYVANPSKTGLHNYGMAVDLTICDLDGKAIDMGTKFDYFGRTAGINQEDQLIAEGLLTRQQVNNRLLLRKIMLQAGFRSIRGEWWHFNACTLNEAKSTTFLIK